MYNTVLLTEKECLVLLKMIDQTKADNNDLYNREERNIHIIKRHLLGMISTNSVYKSIIDGQKPTNEILMYDK